MEKKSIGSFIAALRKSNGLTQQDIAERMNVSNKTVSKWERDESSPDIGLIPAIAELFGVTCDEILLGERALAEELPQGKSGKIDKQIKRLTSSVVTKFKNNAFLAILFAVVGLILVFSVSYAFFAPIVGFGLCLIAVVTGVVVASINLNMANAALDGDEFEECGEILAAKVRVYRNYFAVLATSVLVFALSLPFVIFNDEFYPNSVITSNSYISNLPLMLLLGALLVGLVFVLLRKRMSITSEDGWMFVAVTGARKMCRAQLLMLGGAALVIMSGLLVQFGAEETVTLSSLVVLLPAGGLIIWSIVVVARAAFKAEKRQTRTLLLLQGLRNFLLFCAILATVGGIESGASYDESGSLISAYYYYDAAAAGTALCIAAIAVGQYLVTKYITVAKKEVK